MSDSRDLTSADCSSPLESPVAPVTASFSPYHIPPAQSNLVACQSYNLCSIPSCLREVCLDNGLVLGEEKLKDIAEEDGIGAATGSPGRTPGSFLAGRGGGLSQFSHLSFGGWNWRGGLSTLLLGFQADRIFRETLVSDRTRRQRRDRPFNLDSGSDLFVPISEIPERSSRFGVCLCARDSSRIVLVGGSTGSHDSLPTTTLQYDLRTGQWSQLGLARDSLRPPGILCASAVCTVTGNKDVMYVFGGKEVGDNRVSTMWKLVFRDSEAENQNRWYVVGVGTSERQKLLRVLSRRAMSLGGRVLELPSDMVWAKKEAVRLLESSQSWPEGRAGHAMVLVDSFGRTNDQRLREVPVRSAEDVAALSSSEIPSQDGFLVLFGGRTTRDRCLNDVWIYDLEQENIPRLSLPKERRYDEDELGFWVHDVFSRRRHPEWIKVKCGGKVPPPTASGGVILLPKKGMRHRRLLLYGGTSSDRWVKRGTMHVLHLQFREHNAKQLGEKKTREFYFGWWWQDVTLSGDMVPRTIVYHHLAGATSTDGDDDLVLTFGGDETPDRSSQPVNLRRIRLASTGHEEEKLKLLKRFDFLLAESEKSLEWWLDEEKIDGEKPLFFNSMIKVDSPEGKSPLLWSSVGVEIEAVPGASIVVGRSINSEVFLAATLGFDDLFWGKILSSDVPVQQAIVSAFLLFRELRLRDFMIVLCRSVRKYFSRDPLSLLQLFRDCCEAFDENEAATLIVGEEIRCKSSLTLTCLNILRRTIDFFTSGSVDFLRDDVLRSSLLRYQSLPIFPLEKHPDFESTVSSAFSFADLHQEYVRKRCCLLRHSLRLVGGGDPSVEVRVLPEVFLLKSNFFHGLLSFDSVEASECRLRRCLRVDSLLSEDLQALVNFIHFDELPSDLPLEVLSRLAVHSSMFNEVDLLEATLDEIVRQARTLVLSGKLSLTEMGSIPGMDLPPDIALRLAGVLKQLVS